MANVSINVKAKGERLFSEGKVQVTFADTESFTFAVLGDSGVVHTVFVHKATPDADSCSCKWNIWHRDPVCSHRYAARMVLAVSDILSVA